MKIFFLEMLIIAVVMTIVMFLGNIVFADSSTPTATIVDSKIIIDTKGTNVKHVIYQYSEEAAYTYINWTAFVANGNNILYM